MIEFIQQYWLETLFATIVSGLTLAMKHLYKKVSTEKAAESLEQKMIKEGVLAILHDRLFQACQFYIQRNYITVNDLDNLEYLYTSYHNLGGNGTGTELYSRCKMLPLKTQEEVTI
ncbi:MAG: hypothetical protein RR128_08820 [Clostridium sp.]